MLNRIVELYVDRREGELEDIRQKSVDSPERIIVDAWGILQSAYRGDYSSPVEALERIQRVIIELNQVILKFGDDYSSEAREVRDKLEPFQEAALKELLEDADDLHLKEVDNEKSFSTEQSNDEQSNVKLENLINRLRIYK